MLLLNLRFDIEARLHWRPALVISTTIFPFPTKVVAGDDPDPTRPSEKGSAMLREHCDESLLERSFALQFKERSLEVTRSAG